MTPNGKKWIAEFDNILTHSYATGFIGEEIQLAYSRLAEAMCQRRVSRRASPWLSIRPSQSLASWKEQLGMR